MSRNTLFEQKKSNILEIIQKGQLNDLTYYLNDNDIALEQFNNDKFDLLIYAIEKQASLDIIHYIIQHGGYTTLNYSFYGYDAVEMNHEIFYGVYKVPLFSSIAVNNFEVADLLIKNNADINYIINNFYVLKSEFTMEYCYGDVIDYLNLFNLLNVENLKFILNRGFNMSVIDSRLITEFISYEHENKTKLLEVIFKHFIYDNRFILRFLLFYKNHQSLTSGQLQNLITNEKNKIKINESFYESAYSKKNNNLIDIFLKYDGCKPNELFKRIEKYGKKLLHQKTDTTTK